MLLCIKHKCSELISDYNFDVNNFNFHCKYTFYLYQRDNQVLYITRDLWTSKCLEDYLQIMAYVSRAEEFFSLFQVIYNIKFNFTIDPNSSLWHNNFCNFYFDVKINLLLMSNWCEYTEILKNWYYSENTN